MKRTPQTTYEAVGIFRARLLDFSSALRRLFTIKDFVVMFVLALTFGGIVEHARADIYRCRDANGALVYSQHSCGADAEAVVIKNTTAGVTMTGDGDFSKVDADNRTREIDRAIDRRYRNIDALQSQRDAKLNGLRRQQNTANNNLAGATYRQSIATEMQTVSEDYNARIAAERSAIQDLNTQR